MDNKCLNLSKTTQKSPSLSDRFLCSSPILTESLLKLQQNNEEEEEKEELKDSFKTNIKSSKIWPNLSLTKINRESFKKKKQQQKQLSRFDLILLRAFQQNNNENTSLLPPLPLFTASYSLCSSDGASRHNSLEMLGTFGDFNEKFNYYEEEEGGEGEEGGESLFCSNNSSTTTSARGSACSALLHPDEGAAVSVFQRIERENEKEGNEWNEQIEEETSEKYNNKLTFLFVYF
ncbi:unnamed protein product [Meloidogyne enterolobii]|uniref:Uncharacterized protein n=1 Tax=Meloidogyne enterolobii TaxID=390850 RepID=A0ACB0ZS05_MELEN